MHGRDQKPEKGTRKEGERLRHTEGKGLAAPAPASASASAGNPAGRHEGAAIRAFVGGLYAAHWDGLLQALIDRFSRRYVEDIEDALADCFQFLLAGLIAGRLTVVPDKACAYLFIAARRRYWEIRRIRRRHVSMGCLDGENLPTTHRTPLDEAVRRETAERLRRVIRRALPPRQREIAFMRLEDVDLAVMAELLGISVEAVKVQSSRALARLRKAGCALAS